MCPQGKVVLGGGGRIRRDDGNTSTRLTLRRSTPLTVTVPGSGSHDEWVVEAQEMAPGVSGSWWVDAYAVCATEPRGYQKVVSPLPELLSSDAVQTALARCPSGKRVLGAGAKIWAIDDEGSTAQVGLQVVRSSGPGDITRAQAHEDSSGFTGRWYVVAQAVCADEPFGYEVLHGDGPDRASERDKDAVATCTDPRAVVTGAGATVGNASGSVTLHAMEPVHTADFVHDQAQAHAAEAAATGETWTLASQIICVRPLTVD